MVLIEGRAHPQAAAKRPLEDAILAAAKAPRALLPPGLAPLPPGLLGGLGGLPLPGVTLLPPPGLPLPSHLSALPGAAPPLPPGLPSSGLPQGLHMGQFDLFAHLAATARMSQAMAAAHAPEEAPKKPVAEEKFAFDKEALMRLAKQAQDASQQSSADTAAAGPAVGAAASPAEQGASYGTNGSSEAVRSRSFMLWGAPQSAGAPQLQVPSPSAGGPLQHQVAPAAEHGGALHAPIPQTGLSEQAKEVPSTGGSPVEAAALSSMPGVEAASESPAEKMLQPQHVQEVQQVQQVQQVRQAQQVQQVSMEWTATKPAVDEPRKKDKKDTSSVASFLQQVQDNVARGRSSAKPGEKEGAAAAASWAEGAAHPAGAGHEVDALHHRLENIGAAEPDAQSSLAADIVGGLPKLEPSRTAELVSKAYSAEAMRTTQFLQDLTLALLPLIARYGSPYLVRILGALACWTLSVSTRDGEGRVRFPDNVRPFFVGATAELSLRLMDMAPRDLSNMATALSSVGLADERSFSSLARAAVARSERFLPEEMVTVAMAFDRVGYFHAELCMALARCVQPHVGTVPVRELVKSLQVLAGCCVRDAELCRSMGDRLQRCQEGELLSPEDLCSAAWAFCALGFYHGPLFKAALGLSGQSYWPGGSGTDALCLLYELHMALKAIQPERYRYFELGDTEVHALRQHYKKHTGGKGREVRLERASEKVHKDISKSLREVVEGTITRQHQMDTGFVVDVAVARRRSVPTVAIVEIDGPHSLLRSLDPSTPQQGQPLRLRGATLLKRRLLQQQGHRLVVISEELWRSLADGREKRDFLRELLRSAGVPKDRFT